MASNNNNGLPPTQEIIRLYKEALDQRVLDCVSEKDAKVKERLTKDKVEQYKICEYVKAQETNTIYTNLRFYLSEGANKESIKVKEAITGLKTQNQELLAKIKALAGMAKTIKTKMGEAVDQACRLERTKEEEKRCKKDIYDALEAGVENIWERLAQLKTDTDNNFKMISKVFDGLVDVAGIQTFPNLDILLQKSEDLINCTGVLKQDVAANITSSSAKITTAGNDISTVQTQLCDIKYAKSGIVSKLKALEDQKTFVDNPTCPADPLPEIKKVCKTIEYKEDEDSSDPEDSDPGAA